ncbi:MAG: Hsp20/alpha crystallin family protein [Proteobacteria bacterium]|nr:Hsp20/alpha crystallin family protein [Pseudomonadota bacterium]MBU1452923.1 Hsp20/alpha crystallin family protein [Pseudomonadota bacterium]MBU2468129.1 Hsp20/alpha crystallin family protein [Pseudomonadota bacterium]MBU2519611.1 Hsp20/alpha crystallin family protein [Pseudomonadota bacterium]
MTYLVPYPQSRGVNRLRREVDDLFSRFFESGPPKELGEAVFMPALNLKETETAFEVSAEVPGLKPEEIKVEYEDGVLTLSGEKKEEREEHKGNYHLVERRFGSFSRSVRLPKEVDVEQLKATHKDGVLVVELPKAAKSAGKTIEVKAG